MEVQKSLGIYLRKETATVVCLGKEDGGSRVPEAFSVSIEDKEEKSIQGLINLIAQTCSERRIQFSETAVALDCSMYMQHNVHSEFTDLKQISQTVRFDIEEVLATDATDKAIAFTINSTGEEGSTLTAFTAKKELLTDIIAALQSNKMDPVTIEPDVNCLGRYISIRLDGSEQGYPLFAILSKHNAYYISGITGADKSGALSTRACLLGKNRNRTEFLHREIPITIAFSEAEEKISRVRVYDAADSLDYENLSEGLTIKAEKVNLLEEAGIEPQTAEACEDAVSFASAYGAAVAYSDKGLIIDFRDDFMSYQGKKKRFQKAMRYLSVSVTVLLIALGVYLQMQLFQQNTNLSKANKRFGDEYATVMMGQSLPKKENPVKKLGRELVRVRSLKSGRSSATGEKSTSTKLTLILAAFNKCAAQIDLRIANISITSHTITVDGTTSSRKNTLQLRKAIEKNNLKIQKDSLELKGGRDSFRITIQATS